MYKNYFKLIDLSKENQTHKHQGVVKDTLSQMITVMNYLLLSFYYGPFQTFSEKLPYVP